MYECAWQGLYEETVSWNMKRAFAKKGEREIEKRDREP